MTQSPPALAGKVALITGASRGIGAGIAKRLASDGAAVAITYAASPAKAAEVVEEIKALGGAAMAIHADSADLAAVRSSVRQTVSQFGAIDILVNNAGIAQLSPITEFTDADFERILTINVRAVFAAIQEASQVMRDGGRIINIGSINSDFVPFVGGSVYALSKGALAGFTRGVARDLGPRGITVNNIQPGPVDTDMNPATGAFADAARSLLAQVGESTADSPPSSSRYS
jgi:3-oxoacyl-[acyl-carrier protein] reductase